MASPDSDHSSDYYYFIVAVAIIVVILLASNVAAIACCSRCSLVQAIKRCLRSWGILARLSEDDQISQLIPSCRYKKEQAAANIDCSVCLTALAEGEEVRQLPKCKHSFHAPCIDMWLYSHSNCPMCRANVLPETSSQYPMEGAREEGRGRSLVNSGRFTGATGVVVSIL